MEKNVAAQEMAGKENYNSVFIPHKYTHNFSFLCRVTWDLVKGPSQQSLNR